MTYLLTKTQFNLIKDEVSHAIFWRENAGWIIVKQVAPSKYTKALLSEFNTKSWITKKPPIQV